MITEVQGISSILSVIGPAAGAFQHLDISYSVTAAQLYHQLYDHCKGGMISASMSSMVQKMVQTAQQPCLLSAPMLSSPGNQLQRAAEHDLATGKAVTAHCLPLAVNQSCLLSSMLRNPDYYTKQHSTECRKVRASTAMHPGSWRTTTCHTPDGQHHHPSIATPSLGVIFVVFITPTFLL